MAEYTTCLYLLVGYIYTNVFDLISMFSIYKYIYKHTMDICMYVYRLVIKKISKDKHTRMHLHPYSLPAHSLLPCTAYLHAHAAALAAARCSPPSPCLLPQVILACACAMPQSCRAAYMNQLPSSLCPLLPHVAGALAPRGSLVHGLCPAAADCVPPGRAIPSRTLRFLRAAPRARPRPFIAASAGAGRAT
jgi:hypothetical protein